MASLELSPGERDALERLAQDSSAPARSVLRAGIVLQASSGLTNKEIARRLHTSPPTVALWRDRYARLGLAGLRDQPRPGRPRVASAARPLPQKHGSRSAARSSADRSPPAGEPFDAALDPLLEAAARTISRRGFAATRVTDIANEAGVSPATIHYYFKTRREILVRALLWTYERLVSRLEEVSARDDPITRLASFIDRTIPYSGAQRDEYLLEIDLWSQVRLHPELLPAWESFAERWIAHLAKLIDAGIDAGCFHTSVPAPELAERLAALTDGLSAQAAIQSTRMPLPRLRTLVLRFAAEQLGVPLETLEHHVQLAVYQHEYPGRRLGGDHLALPPG